MLPTTAPQISHSIHYKLGVNKPTDLKMCLTFTSSPALSRRIAPPVSEMVQLGSGRRQLSSSCNTFMSALPEQSCGAFFTTLRACSLQMRKIISQFPHIWIRHADSRRVFSPCLSVFQMQLLALPIS